MITFFKQIFWKTCSPSLLFSNVFSSTQSLPLPRVIYSYFTHWIVNLVSVILQAAQERQTNICFEVFC